MRLSIYQHSNLRRAALALLCALTLLAGLLPAPPSTLATTGLTFTIGDTDVVEGNAGRTTALFFVDVSSADPPIECDVNNPQTCFPPPPVTVCVDFRTVNGTAVAGQDYEAVSGTLRITAENGSGTGTIAVPVIGDLLVEGPETFTVQLSISIVCPTNASPLNTFGRATIIDDEPALAIKDVRIVEGDAGTTSATFTVTLANATGQPVQVDVATANGTAAAFADYTPVSTTLQFADAKVSQTVVVPIIGDLLDESDETFTVNLSNAVGARIADGQGQATIDDDDGAALQLLKLVCDDREDTLGQDEPYIRVGGRLVWQGADVRAGDSISLERVAPIAFTGSVALELYEDDEAPNADDFLGRHTVSEAEVNTGVRVAKFAEHGAVYRIYYRVD